MSCGRCFKVCPMRTKL
ncbi:hypothetical protein [Faecalibacterium prausnitzii]